jgi:hypothetical protein
VLGSIFWRTFELFLGVADEGKRFSRLENLFFMGCLSEITILLTPSLPKPPNVLTHDLLEKHIRCAQ